MNRLTQLERLDLGSNEFTEVVSSHKSQCCMSHISSGANCENNVMSSFLRIKLCKDIHIFLREKIIEVLKREI